MSDSIALIDVVIPVHDRPDWLELCLIALRNWTANPYRIIVVDNKSQKPQTQVLFDRVSDGEFGPGLVVRLNENKSFSNACNAGVRAGSAPNIVILNSDALVTPGWDSCILQDLADKKVGLTGARSNAASGLQSDSAGLANIIDPNFLVFICVGLRREVWDQVGPMDEERFDGFSCEDLDFSWTIKKNGGRLKVSNAYVLHGLSQTLATVVGGIEARNKNNEKYQARLVEKWGREWCEAATRVTPKVVVATFSAEEHTRVEFMKNMLGLRKGTAFDFAYLHVTRHVIHLARQIACQQALAAKKDGFTHILMVDDDAAEIPPDAINRLMKHNKDVVGVVAYQRGAPFGPCVFELAEDKLHMNAIEIEHTGLRKVDAVGMHMTLIRLDVFERLTEFPVNALQAKGETDRIVLQRAREKGKKWWGHFEQLGEDLYFCDRAREAGIEIFCDTDLILGHIGNAQIVNEGTRKAWKAQGGK